MNFCLGDSLRSIIEETDVQDYIDEQLGIYPRLAEVYEALKWRLSRKPESGVRVMRNKNFYVIKTIELNSPKIPALRALYSFDENEVTIIALEVLK